MYRRLSMIFFPIVTVALIGAGFWGYQQRQEKNMALIKAENQYQRAFHDLSYHIDQLHTEMGNTLAMSSTYHDGYRKGLVNIWRLTGQAQSEIAQLPLTNLPFNKTVEFLSNMANFSYRTAVRDLSKKPLTDNEMKTLSTLYNHSAEITSSLQKVQTNVLSNHLHWMDAETAISSVKGPQDNMIVDGFKAMDQKVDGYNMEWDPAITNMYKKRNFNELGGNEATPQEIQQKAAKLLNRTDVDHVNVTENGQGSDVQTFTATVPEGKTGGEIRMDFTKKGGHLISIANPRPVHNKAITLREARDKAAEFLDQRGYKNMSAISYDELMNVADITFAPKIKDVSIYPEKVVTQIALDNGEIIGLEASDYVFSHKESRPQVTPAFPEAEARKQINAKMKISNQTLAVIPNDMNEEVLCYEYVGAMDGRNYRIYINAKDGVTEKVEQIQSDHGQAAR